jgi:HEPN domain-containing protein
MLKAHIAEVTKSSPVRTHDLLYCLKLSGTSPPQDHVDFLGRINNASVPTRYPADVRRAVSEYPEAVAQQYLGKTIEVIEWLKAHPNLKV